MRKPMMYSLLLFLIVLFAWEGLVRFLQIPELILPTPLVIGKNLIENFSNGYFYPHIAATSIEVFGGFALGAFMGIGLGFLVSNSKAVEEVLHPYIIASQAMPKLALAPLLALWFGFGYLPKILIVALVSFFPLFESTVTGLTYVDQDKVALFRSMRASKWSILVKLRLPTAIPYLFSGLRVAIVLSVVGAVVSEFIGANKGLGALIIVSQGMMDTPLMFSVFILLTFMGIALYQMVAIVEILFFKKYYYTRRTKT
ncbi:ABC transporter permease [Ammoniphilus sp. CFH 90114]|nr:ABC transporter permease [Ammoniphilus sp. CFH 90114]